jgi:hypothetical protein
MPFLLSESNADRAGLDEECALWDWARTAGVSVAELRQWLAGKGKAWNESRSALFQPDHSDTSPHAAREKARGFNC